MKLAVWGAGGHGGVVLDAVQKQGTHEAVLVIDDQPPLERRHRSGLPIRDRGDILSTLRGEGVSGVIIAIGNELRRAEAAGAAVKAGLELCTVIHPSAVIC